LQKYPEIEKALSTQRPVVLQDISNNPLWSPSERTVKDLADKALFVVPIIKKQNVIGTFFLRTLSPLKGGITDRVFKPLSGCRQHLGECARKNAVAFRSDAIERRDCLRIWQSGTG